MTITSVFKYQFTGTGAIGVVAVCPNPGQHRRVLSVMLHLNGNPGVEDFTITLNNVNGAAYDTLILTQAMNGITDLYWYPPSELVLAPGDALDFVMTGAAGKVFGLEATMREVT